MYELIKINENDYYIDCPSKIGIVKISENDVVLIDGGNDANAGKKILKILNENNWKLKAVFNTHSHADHIGGNKYLIEKTGCKCYCYGREYTFASLPILETFVIYGALPINEIKNKFLYAPQSEVFPLTEDVLPEGMEIINLPGHTLDMVGFITKDKTAYIADIVSSENILEKYGICYLMDYEETLKSLEKIKNIDAKCFVPSHADVTNDISPLADYNIDLLLKTERFILDICKTPTMFEDILKQVFDFFSLSMSTQQYALVGSTCRSFLTVLERNGAVSYEFVDNKMLWKTN